MSADKRIVLITGATGRQGGAVARQLVGKGFEIRALTRKPKSEPARILTGLDCEVVQGDLDDPESLGRALDGVWGVFAIQNTWEAGVEQEEEQGKRIARLAREKGVQHFVYSSVASAQRRTGIPHFDSKWHTEEAVRKERFPSHVILRPVFFMENLTSPWFLKDDNLLTAMKPDTVLQMIAVEDIGKLGARAFTHAAEMNGDEIDFAGDAVTLPAAAEIIGRRLGRRIAFKEVPIEEVRKSSEDFAIMLEWFDRVGYDADIDGVQAKYDLRFLELEEWARKNVRP